MILFGFGFKSTFRCFSRPQDALLDVLKAHLFVTEIVAWLWRLGRSGKQRCGISMLSGAWMSSPIDQLTKRKQSMRRCCRKWYQLVMWMGIEVVTKNQESRQIQRNHRQGFMSKTFPLRDPALHRSRWVCLEEMHESSSVSWFLCSTKAQVASPSDKRPSKWGTY